MPEYQDVEKKWKPDRFKRKSFAAKRDHGLNTVWKYFTTSNHMGHGETHQGGCGRAFHHHENASDWLDAFGLPAENATSTKTMCILKVDPTERLR